MSESTIITKQRGVWLLIGLIVTSIISFNVYLAFNTIKNLSAIQVSLANTGNIILRLDDLHISVISAESGQRGYLLTNDAAFLKPYQSALDKVQAQIAALKALDSEIPAQQQRIARIIDLSTARIAELEQHVTLVKNDKSALSLLALKATSHASVYEQLRQLFNDVNIEEKVYRAALLQRLSKSKNEALVTFTISGITSAMLVIILLLISWSSNRKEQQYLQLLEQKNINLEHTVAERTQELNLYAEELSRSNRELEDFAFVASHDLQEPLRKIQAFGDRLESSYADALTERGLDYLHRMRNAASRMSTLITDLLEFSRVGTRGRDFATTDLNQVLEQVLDDLEIAIKESAAQIDIVGSLPTIQADNSQLQQLFLNLLSNAIKFRQAKQAVHIVIKSQAYAASAAQLALCDNWYQLTISDNGIGFAPEYAEKIFTPFQRLHGRTEYKGTGIGLAVCRRIVERHRGEISASSKLGQGATFSIILPEQATAFAIIGDEDAPQQS
ncbi:sensor histidine kinase [Rheinheimera sp. MMS21-TC3]|uniref:sensor histidine kinase n=1 Tax=Rheinheimera sp. MMS21-TC3 TaxID=3072790 RepID=UPI0028C4FA82|nr:ATP-binding protein [Rheinheimera sp. MMS21-TC3]WNO60294.1 ATP-binding protein [Rheinheimera sp. MMS21-TC3]